MKMFTACFYWEKRKTIDRPNERADGVINEVNTTFLIAHYAKFIVDGVIIDKFYADGNML